MSILNKFIKKHEPKKQEVDAEKERIRILDEQQAKYDKDRIETEKKIKKNKTVFRTCLAAALSLIVILFCVSISNNVKLSRYEKAVEYFVSGDFENSDKEFSKLNGTYKDVDDIENLTKIISDFKEDERYNYSSTLNKLDKVKIENEDALLIKNRFESKVSALEKQYKLDVEKADNVDREIQKSCTNITINSAPLIISAARLYNAQSESVKSLVKNAELIESAKQEYALVKASYDKGTAVKNKIAKIGKVSLKSKNKLVSLRAEYNALTYDEQAYVNNLSVLENAEKQYKKLEDDKKKKDEAKKKKEADKKKKAKSKKKTNSSSTSATVYWVPNGKVYHKTDDCPTLSRSRTIYSGHAPSGRRKCKVCYR